MPDNALSMSPVFSVLVKSSFLTSTASDSGVWAAASTSINVKLQHKRELNKKSSPPQRDLICDQDGSKQQTLAVKYPVKEQELRIRVLFWNGKFLKGSWLIFLSPSQELFEIVAGKKVDNFLLRIPTKGIRKSTAARTIEPLVRNVYWKLSGYRDHFCSTPPVSKTTTSLPALPINCDTIYSTTCVWLAYIADSFDGQLALIRTTQLANVICN